jgi:pyruvate,orthophosphate dikinase
MQAGRSFPDGLEEQVDEALDRLEEQAGKSLGDPDDPLLVSVRSGARESMPGMMDTVLNLGLNDESVVGLGDDRFAWDSYRRFVQMFGNVCRGIPGERYEDLISEVGRDLDTDGLRELTDRFKQVFEEETGEGFRRSRATS